MSAFNAFFAQLTGGGAPAGDAPPSAAAAASASASAAAGGSADHRGNGTADGGGGGGGRADGVFGVPLTGAAVTYDPESDRSRFGNPQVRYLCFRRRKRRREMMCAWLHRQRGVGIIGMVNGGRWFVGGVVDEERVVYIPVRARQGPCGVPVVASVLRHLYCLVLWIAATAQARRQYPTVVR